jgi:hypothetical protein
MMRSGTTVLIGLSIIWVSNKDLLFGEHQNQCRILKEMEACNYYQSIGPDIFEPNFFPQSNFEGVWINEDEKTRHIPKCEITYQNNRFYVHMWGSCEPEDCDWGEAFSDEMDINSNKIKLYWDQGFVERTQILEYNNGIIVMSTESRYRDYRPNNVQIDRFVKL